MHFKAFEAIRVLSSHKTTPSVLNLIKHSCSFINHYLTNSNWIWFSVVYTLIFNGMRHHSGQNVDSRGAAE